jgi:hypothetical protein
MKKTILLLASIFLAHSSYSQDDVAYVTNTGLQSSVQSFVNSAPLSQGSGLWVRSASTSSDILGSIYMFKSWTTNATLLTEGGKSFTITNLNYDTQTNRFVSKMGLDSVFVFSPSDLKEVFVNKKKYKRFPSNVNNFDFSYYNITARVKSAYILKKTNKILRDGVLNKLTQKKSKSKFISSSKYYYYKNEMFTELVLKKKSVLALVDADKRKVVKKYAKKNSLSFKKDEDLNKILNYYNKL